MSTPAMTCYRNTNMEIRMREKMTGLAPLLPSVMILRSIRCVFPHAWGERITGSPVSCRCLLCHEEGRHHAVRCIQCLNAPGCCSCIWGYMRIHYNSGCPLCRHGDPKGENPLGSSQRRQAPRRRSQLVLRGRGRCRRAIGRGLLCEIGSS